ncbi:MAG: formate--tetrahydrofolate ligase [Marmoricola sp.]
MLTDGEIAEAAEMLPITQVAADKLNVPSEALVPYGHHMAKLETGYLHSIEDNAQGKLVLVTAISPTPAGEGKTTTVVGLTDGLQHIGVKACAALREPSMGPVFGMKGGAAGGGYAQVVPMTDINLHFTGDFAAIAAANNLLAALIDNHINHGNALEIDPRTITWKRVLDMNDRALRDIVIALGGTANGFPREDGFDIVVASELMAIFCLATSLSDLKDRIGRIVVAHNRAKEPITAAQLDAQGALTILLKNALQPNLVQTLEHSPAFVHGGPFANIAHGCNSVLATRTALRLADVVVTEAGFGADLGAEKFFDLKCRLSGLRPSAVVIVTTCKALKFHGGVAVADVKSENLEAIEKGAANLRKHLQNLRDVFGVPAVVAINRWPHDTDAEIALVKQLAEAEGATAYAATHAAEGGAGAAELAAGVMEVLAKDAADFRFAYPDEGVIADKATAVATKIYGADKVTFTAKALKQIAQIEKDGFGHLPICVAKTQYSFSTDPKAVGAPTGHTLDVREVRLSAGAGFVVLITGEIMTMPGLPKVPASAGMDIDAAGRITGLS